MTIQSLMGNQIRLHELSAMIIKIALKSYIQTKNGESENLLIDQWQGLDAFYGKKVKVTTSNETVLGRAEGINIEGHFKVKLRNGRFKYFASVEDLEKDLIDGKFLKSSMFRHWEYIFKSWYIYR